MKPQERTAQDGTTGSDDIREDDVGRVYVLEPVLRAQASQRAGGHPQNPEKAQQIRSPEGRLAEAVGLAEAINLTVVGAAVVKIAEPKPATLFGRGKVAEIGAVVRAEGAALVIVDFALSPVQQRNLEKAWNAKILDRTGLILEIFGERARTKEGRLQVELAHLTYQKSRLVRSWTHLERQRGGFGFLGGPGETQIEADRRLIQERINRLEKDLNQVRRTRGLHRSARKKVPHPIVALVGYTNAGKSTLFNRLTDSSVMAEDLLFATLDPTLRQVTLTEGHEAILSDTVGFISDLPTHLVAAFRATLEEVVEADLILHVRDISHPETEAQADDVSGTLAILDIDARDQDRVLEVWNKIDLLSVDQREKLLDTARYAGSPSAPVAVSAWTGEGTDTLLQAIERRLTARHRVIDLTLPAQDGELLAWLYRHADILERHDDEASIRLSVRVQPQHLDAVRQRCGMYVTTGKGPEIA